jgi:uncharacterized membrane protein
MDLLSGYRRVVAVLLLLVPTVLSFFGITLPQEALQSVFDGFDKILAAVLVILSARRPADSVIAKS